MTRDASWTRECCCSLSPARRAAEGGFERCSHIEEKLCKVILATFGCYAISAPPAPIAQSASPELLHTTPRAPKCNPNREGIAAFFLGGARKIIRTRAIKKPPGFCPQNDAKAALIGARGFALKRDPFSGSGSLARRRLARVIHHYQCPNFLFFSRLRAKINSFSWRCATPPKTTPKIPL